ncbi:MAG: DHA2 family efflux MFS transporter permease subunit, partial [Desulfuromonadales bacterium]|nr:DHA2 family efflux MFS transporter permease subunit [Desulfuromonadales bacterium]
LYIIAEVIMIPLAGWLSRALSLRHLYVLACTLFTLASILCAFAWSLETMLIFRVFQGLCAGAMIPLLYQAIYTLFPRERQANVTLFVVLIIALAPTIGPTLGGWITQAYSWRWLFLLNVLPGMVVSCCVFFLVKSAPPNFSLLKKFDFLGIVLIALFLGCLECLLSEGAENDWFESQQIVVLAFVVAASAGLLLWRELTCAHPVINLGAFRDRNFATGCVFNFIMGFGLFGSGYLMTVFLSGVRNYNSLEIGKVMMAPGLAMMLSLPIVRLCRTRLGGRTTLAIGLVLFGLSLGLNAFMNAEFGLEQLVLPQAMRGFAMMMCMSPITELALGRLPAEAVANASSLYSLMRYLGGGIGIAVINTLVEFRSALHQQRLAEALNPARFPGSDIINSFVAPVAGQTVDLAQAQQGGVQLLSLLVGRESLLMTCNDIWLLIACLFGISFMLMPTVQKVTPRG